MTTVVIRGEILSEELELDIATLIRCCELQQQDVIAMVDAGLLEPRGEQPASWRFSGLDLQRARLARRLTRDLGVNVAGVALIVELLEERAALQRQIRLLNAFLEEHDPTSR